VLFSGDPAQFEGWVTLTRSLMSEAGLSRVMSGAETAPEPLAAGATETQIAEHEKTALKFKEKNGKVYTRLLLATSDGPDGYSSPASQVVQQHGPVGDEEYGDGRGAFVALQQKYRVEGVFRMQQLHEELASVMVTAADKYDPARAIQQLRRICLELDKLGDTVVETRKAGALLRALPNDQYGSFKNVLMSEKTTLGSNGLVFEEIARRATSYHAMQIRGEMSDHGDGSGSHGRALNTVAHGGARGLRRHGGRGGRGARGGRSRRGNGETLEVAVGVRMMAATVKDVVDTAVTAPSTGGTTALSAGGTRRRTTTQDRCTTRKTPPRRLGTRGWRRRTMSLKTSPSSSITTSRS